MAKMYYTEDEAAAKLTVDAAGLTDLVRQHKLRLFKDGDRNMYMASEVDALAPEETASDEVELAPVEDAITLDVADASVRPTKEDTVITTEGISIFDDEDLEIETADASAQTQVSPSVEDQIASEGIGSGSGLLDLTRESDDTSLGEVIDHIDLDETAGGLPPMDATAASYGVVPQADAVVVAPEATDELDASGGLFGGLIVGAAVVVLLIGVTALAVGAGVVPGYLAALKENITIALIGAVVLVVVFGVVGLMIGKSVEAKRRALLQMGG